MTALSRSYAHRWLLRLAGGWVEWADFNWFGWAPRFVRRWEVQQYATIGREKLGRSTFPLGGGGLTNPDQGSSNARRS